MQQYYVLSSSKQQPFEERNFQAQLKEAIYKGQYSESKDLEYL